MYIEFGKNYVLDSDEHNIILKVKAIQQTGENAGKEYLKTEGYFQTIEAAFRHVVNLEIRKSEAKSIKELGENVNKIKQDINEVLREFKEVTV